MEIFNICENYIIFFLNPVKGQYKLVFSEHAAATQLAHSTGQNCPPETPPSGPGFPRVTRLVSFPFSLPVERERECILQPLAFCCMPCFLGGENGGCCSASLLLLCPFSLIDTSFSGSCHGRPFTFGKNREDRPCSLLFRFVVFSSLSL